MVCKLLLVLLDKMVCKLLLVLLDKIIFNVVRYKGIFNLNLIVW